MKNKLKYLALLLILPVVFAFAGCGSQLDGNAKVDTGKEAKYEAATMQDLTNYVDGLTETEDATAVPAGVKVTVSFQAGSMANGKFNVIFKTTETEGDVDVELAVRATVNAKIDDETNLKVKADAYYKEDVLYLDANVTGLPAEMAEMATTVNGKHKLDLSEMGGLLGLLGMAEGFLPVETEELPIDNILGILADFDVAAVAEMLGGMGIEFDVSTYTEGVVTRFKLSAVDEETNDTIVAYLVFANGVLAGVKVDAQMTDGDEVMSLSLALEAFAGNIEYPNFNNFQDFAMPELPR